MHCACLPGSLYGAAPSWGRVSLHRSSMASSDLLDRRNRVRFSAVQLTLGRVRDQRRFVIGVGQFNSGTQLCVGVS